MEIQEAVKIIKTLADGLNPETGESLASDAVWKNSLAVRAMHRAVGALEDLERRELNRKLQPKNSGRSWSGSEDAQLCEEVRTGNDFQKIAKLHDRSVASIVARLIHLGKVSAKLPPAKVA